MTAATITLNVGTGGDKPLVDTLTTVDGATAPTGASAQMVKIGHGAASDFKTASAANPLPIGGTVTGVFFQATQPVSAASLPLPAGAATETTVAGVRTDLGTDGTTPPAVLGAGTGVRGWLRSIYEKLTGTIAVTGTFFQATQPVSLATNTPDVTDRAARLLGAIANTSFAATNAGTFAVQAASTLAAETTKVIGTVNVAAGQTVGLVAGAAVIGALTANQSVNTAQIAGVATATGSGISGTGVQRVVLATDIIQPAVSEIRAATLGITFTALVNTGATATLPAPAAGLFHYITSVQLVKLYAALGVASAAGVVVTSTNLPGGLAWTTEQAAGALGTAPTVINYAPTTPLKASAAAVATTFVAPAQLQTIWRWNVTYFTAA